MKQLNHKIVAVDLDDTILHEPGSNWEEHIPVGYSPVLVTGEPIKDVIEAFNILKEEGFEIVIFTCRTNSEEECNKPYSSEAVEFRIRLRLKELGVPFDRISFYKPVADIYVDDRGFHFENWKATIEFLHKLGWVNRIIGE